MPTTTQDTETRDKNAEARKQALAQMESITAMVERLTHSDECDGDDPEECEATDAEIIGGLGYGLDGGRKATDAEREQYHNREEAREAIQEDALSVEVRTDWYTPGETPEASEFCILLCTGGPAVRIRGDLGAHNEPDRAYLECQDWYTAWEEVINGVDHDALLTYARQFYFGD